MTPPAAPRTARGGLSLATRLTLLFALVSGLALAVLAGVTLLALNLHFETQDRDVLHAQLQRARSLLARVDNTGALSTLPDELQRAFVLQKGLAIRVQGAYGQPLFEQRSEAQMPAALLAKPATAPPVPLLHWREGPTAWRGSARAAAAQAPVFNMSRRLIMALFPFPVGGSSAVWKAKPPALLRPADSSSRAARPP